MPRDMIEPGDEPRPVRDVWQAMARGFAQRCPKCGKGALFHSYLKVADTCPACGEELHHQRADDAPPYFTIMIVGHFVVGGVLSMEKAFVAADLGAYGRLAAADAAELAVAAAARQGRADRPAVGALHARLRGRLAAGPYRQADPRTG